MAARVRRMFPDVRASDLEPGGAGVRAQAVRPDGGLVDDFLFAADGAPGTDGSVLHVLNAPSPAATAALPIGREVAARLTGERMAVAG
jgi:L-2-hydroxyglutarate oxidase